MASELVEAIKKWQEAVKERDKLLTGAYTEIKLLRRQVKSLTVERDELKSQLEGAKAVTEEPPAPPTAPPE